MKPCIWYGYFLLLSKDCMVLRIHLHWWPPISNYAGSEWGFQRNGIHKKKIFIPRIKELLQYKLPKSLIVSSFKFTISRNYFDEKCTYLSSHTTNNCVEKQSLKSSPSTLSTTQSNFSNLILLIYSKDFHTIAIAIARSRYHVNTRKSQGCEFKSHPLPSSPILRRDESLTKCCSLNVFVPQSIYLCTYL